MDIIEDMKVCLCDDMVNIVMSYVKDIEYTKFIKFKLVHHIHPSIKQRYVAFHICDRFNTNFVLDVRVEPKKIISALIYLLLVKSMNQDKHFCDLYVDDLFIDSLICDKHIDSINKILNDSTNYDYAMNLVDYLFNTRNPLYRTTHLLYTIDSSLIKLFLELIKQLDYNIVSLLSVMNIRI